MILGQLKSNDVEILGRIRMSAVTKGSLISIVSSIDDVDGNNERKYNMPNLGRVNGHGWVYEV